MNEHFKQGEIIHSSMSYKKNIQTILFFKYLLILIMKLLTLFLGYYNKFK